METTTDKTQRLSREDIESFGFQVHTEDSEEIVAHRYWKGPKVPFAGTGEGLVYTKHYGAMGITLWKPAGSMPVIRHMYVYTRAELDFVLDRCELKQGSHWYYDRD